MVSVVSVGEEAHLESTLLKSSPEYKHSCCSVGGKRVCSFSETSPTDVGTGRWVKLESIVKISNHLLIRLHPQQPAESTLVEPGGNLFVTAQSLGWTHFSPSGVDGCGRSCDPLKSLNMCSPSEAQQYPAPSAARHISHTRGHPPPVCPSVRPPADVSLVSSPTLSCFCAGPRTGPAAAQAASPLYHP